MDRIDRVAALAFAVIVVVVFGALYGSVLSKHRSMIECVKVTQKPADCAALFAK